MTTNRELEYRKIPSTKFMYEVSEDGRYVRNVKSKRYLTMKKRGSNNYYAVHISYGHRGYDKWVYVHTLVAECWLGPKPEGLQVDHIDRNKYNNHHGNLRYVTQSENNYNKDYQSPAYVKARAKLHEIQNVPVYVDGVRFESKTAAAQWLVDNHGGTLGTQRNKLVKHKHYIYGHTIRYSDAETVR